MKSWDVIIIGAGIIGLSLAISLRKQGLQVLIVERGAPGRESSHAAAGMLTGSGSEILPALRDIAQESARLYPEFAHELEDESGIKVDLRDQGTILCSTCNDFPESAERVSQERVRTLEPALEFSGPAAYLSERSVDPRSLVAAAIKAAHHREVDVSSGSEVQALLVEDGRVAGVQTARTSYSAPVVVNCAGAWAGNIAPHKFPVRPVKGQMVALVDGPGLEHVVRAENVYLVPRSDGRLVIGSTLEDAGYNKQTDVETIQNLFHAAIKLVPALSKGKIHESWAGLRPGTPDELPMLGETSTAGYFLATGHYRDGILLAPATAQVMTDLILRRPPGYDLRAFSPARFSAASSGDVP
jgi:glycine oxidase ThiO